jgi:hypothetical protein
MKKVFTLSMVACYMLISKSSKAQVRISTGLTVQANLPAISATSFDRLRVQGGLISHFETGTVGSFGATDKWIGIGAPLSSLYGKRIQWNGQALNTALRNNTNGTKDALIEWGNGGGEMQFRYITNPNVSTGSTKILSLTAAGNAYVGDNPSLTFIDPINNPFQNITTPKFEINSNFSPALGVKSTTGYSGYFKNDVSTCVLTESGPSIYNSSVNTGGILAIAKNGFINTAINAEAYSPLSTQPFQSNVALQANSYGVGGTSAIGTAIGISVRAYDAATCYALLAQANPNVGGVGYAGYFTGSVIASSYTTFSDRNLKKSIVTESNDIIDKIEKLRPVTYNYDNKISPDMVLPNTLQHGFIAQEIQEIFPEVVTEIAHPVFKDKKLVETKKVLGVNYNMLVSILTKAIQEENTQIKNLESRIAELENKLSTTLQKSVSANTIENIKDFTLSQNTPNPFSGSTTISYSLPANTKNASIALFDLTGKMLFKFDNIINGKSQVVIDGNKLSSGIYLYSLLVDGAEMITKRMIVNK